MARKRTSDKCIFLDCGRPYYCKSLCSAHYSQYKNRGKSYDALTPLRPRGVGYLDSRGYRIIHRPEHPNSNSKGLVREHTFVMAEHLGRPLEPHENVHHLNGDRADNRLENLELWSTHQPQGQRVIDKLRWAREIEEMYGEQFGNQI